MFSQKYRGMNDRDLKKLVRKAFKTLRRNFTVYKTRKYQILTIFKEFKHQIIYYDGNRISFNTFLNRVIEEFKDLKSPLRLYCKDLLIQLMTIMKEISPLMSHRLRQFINTQHGYKVTDSDSINLLNFLLNYKYYGEIDTLALIKDVYPELLEHVTLEPRNRPDRMVGGKTRKHARSVKKDGSSTSIDQGSD